MISNRKKAFYRGILFSLVVLLLVVFDAEIQSVSANNRTLRIGVYENAPKIFISESGKPAGIFIDIIENIAEREGWLLRYVPGSWREGLDRLAKGEIDLMPDVAYTAERGKIFSYHKVPVLSSWFQVYAQKGSGIRSILDLAGKRIAVLERSVQEEAFLKLAAGFELNATLIALQDYKKIFEMVASGEADAAITNRFYGIMHAKMFGLEDTSVIFHPSNLFFASFKNASKQLLDTIDKHLLDLKNDPQSAYYASLKRWISGDVRFKLPTWVVTLGLISGVVLLMSLAGTLILKHQVNVRTRQLREINNDMEQRIVERTAELAAATEEAKAADQIKSAFLATMSHELRTPLNSIIGFTGIILQGLAGPLNEEQNKQMTMVQGSARHLLALINDVLDISKIEAGELSLSIESFDLKTSIEKMVKIVSPLAEKKGLDIKLDIADDVKEATADQRRLEQVVLNLINNAVKFTEKGHIHISCRVENEQYVLSVADTGIGIKSEEIPGLFQPFHQIDSGLTRKHEGTGLGLSICKKLLDMMGGNIEVQSQWGLGSTFTIRFSR
ncbi:MAG TPA: ATP-binding protein [Desulfobacteraceae bacterium]|nr:ATP-binding protein [Desulfobacteraceae bacterium]